MGNLPNIDHKSFPKQGKLVGATVDVCFHYNTLNILKGMIVRDDIERPYVTIIQLSDGRHVLSTECQYHVPR